MTHVLNKNFDLGYLNAKPPLNVRFLTPNLFLSTNFMLRIPYHLCFFQSPRHLLCMNSPMMGQDKAFCQKKTTTSCPKNRSKPPMLKPLSETLSLSEIDMFSMMSSWIPSRKFTPLAILQPIEKLLQTTQSWHESYHHPNDILTCTFSPTHLLNNLVVFPHGRFQFRLEFFNKIHRIDWNT